MAMPVDEMRTSMAMYPDNQAIANYKAIMMNMLSLNFPLLSPLELASAIDYTISNTFKDTNITVHNNYKNKTINSTLADITNYILQREPIITAYGVMFNRHGVTPNPIAKMLDGFLKARKAMKKEMFKYPKGSEDFEKYNLLQLLLKIDANG